MGWPLRFFRIFEEKLKEGGGVEGLDGMIDKVILEEIDHSFAYDRILNLALLSHSNQLNKLL